MTSFVVGAAVVVGFCAYQVTQNKPAVFDVGELTTEEKAVATVTSLSAEQQADLDQARAQAGPEGVAGTAGFLLNLLRPTASG